MNTPLMNTLRKRRRVAIDKFEKTLTEQNHKNRVQIQNILNKYTKTGILTHINTVQGSYGDYPTAVDFQTMQNIIANAKTMFNSLPSSIRSEFDNDPAKFLDAVQNPENRDHFLEMGFDAEDLPEPVEVPAPQDPPPEPAPEPAPEPPAEPQP